MELDVPSVFGRYEVQRKLGNGAFGTVYKAWDSHLETHVALKIPQLEGISAQRRAHILARFHREAKAAARLPPHSNICPIRDHGEIEGQPYVALAFLDGRPLSQVRKPQPISTALLIVRRIARAMQVAHDHQVIHRDLKPDNIMIVQRSQPVVMDFGLARRMDSEESLQTADGTVLGTPAYMSPEQAAGQQSEIGPQTDVYSLGAICYEMLTGRRPFEAPSVLGLLSKIATETAAPPSKFNPEIDAALDAICLKAIARNVKERYASMQEWDAALSEYSDPSRGRRRKAPALAQETNHVSPAPTTEMVPAEFFADWEPLPREEIIPSLEFTALKGQWVPQANSQANVATNRGDSSTVRTNGTRLPRSPGKLAWGWNRATLLTAGVLALLLAGVVFLFQSKAGTIRVEINDPDIEVSVKGTRIVLKEADNGKDVSLVPGDKTLVVQRGDFKFETDSLTLKKGETVTIRVELLADRIIVHQGNERIGLGRISDKPRGAKPAKPELLAAPFDADAARKSQQAWADYLDKPDVVETNSIGMELVLIPPGEYMMGTPASETERDADEAQRRVQITKAFYLGETEVTQSQWQRLMQTAPWTGRSYVQVGADYPATCVSWEDATLYCQKLTERELQTGGLQAGWEYRLPTEAEWEYACRAGTTTAYGFGNLGSQLDNYGWYGRTVGNTKRDQYARQVGQRTSNSWGLHDMHGNAWEWCRDWYLTEPPGGSDPVVEFQKSASSRVNRGGSWLGSARDCRSGNRLGITPDYRDDDLGFRVAAVQTMVQDP